MLVTVEVMVAVGVVLAREMGSVVDPVPPITGTMVYPEGTVADVGGVAEDSGETVTVVLGEGATTIVIVDEGVVEIDSGVTTTVDVEDGIVTIGTVAEDNADGNVWSALLSTEAALIDAGGMADDIGEEATDTARETGVTATVRVVGKVWTALLSTDAAL